MLKPFDIAKLRRQSPPGQAPAWIAQGTNAFRSFAESERDAVNRGGWQRSTRLSAQAKSFKLRSPPNQNLVIEAWQAYVDDYAEATRRLMERRQALVERWSIDASDLLVHDSISSSAPLPYRPMPQEVDLQGRPHEDVLRLFSSLSVATGLAGLARLVVCDRVGVEVQFERSRLRTDAVAFCASLDGEAFTLGQLHHYVDRVAIAMALLDIEVIDIDVESLGLDR